MGLESGEKAFVSDHDRIRRIDAVAILPDLVIAAVGIAA